MPLYIGGLEHHSQEQCEIMREVGTLLLLLWRYPSAESMRLKINYAVYLGCNESCSTVRCVMLPNVATGKPGPGVVWVCALHGGGQAAWHPYICEHACGGGHSVCADRQVWGVQRLLVHTGA
eukprot:SAG11_NODE_8123_length_1058_cov_1.077164_2_plen_122_part_00